MCEIQLAERFLEFAECREQPIGGEFPERLPEGDSVGQVLDQQVAAPLLACGVGPAHLARQDAAGREPVAVEAPDARDGSFDREDGRRRQRQRKQPAVSLPLNFGIGEAGRAHEFRKPVRTDDGPGIGQFVEGEVGRQQRPGKSLDRRSHGYSVFTLMEPMLSMAMSCSAEAL